MASIFLREKEMGEGYQLINILKSLLEIKRGLIIMVLLQMKEKYIC